MLKTKGGSLTPIELNNQVLDLVSKTQIFDIDDHLNLLASGQYAEVYNRSGMDHLYYQWLHSLVKLTKPKQIVELGAAAGISTIMMAAADKEANIYSVDIDPQAWRWMQKDYPNVTKILGDTRDMNIWDKFGEWTDDGDAPGYNEDSFIPLDLKDTDLWFFDSEHLFEVLNKEVELYKPYWKKGAIVVFDDIHMNEGMERVWNSLDYDKCDNSHPCHYPGFGFLIV